MVKIITVMMGILVGVIFVIQNSEHVTMQVLIGSPIKIRLIFVLMIFFIIGYLTAYLNGLRRENSLKKHIRHISRGKFSGGDSHLDLLES